MRRLLFVSVLILTLLPSGARGQQVIQMGAGAVGSFPTGGLDRTVGEPGVGVSGEITVPVGEGWAVGAALGWQIYTSGKQRVPIAPSVPGGEAGEAEMLRSHNIAAGHLFLRRRARTGTVRPYAELLVGFVYPFTRMEITTVRLIDSDPAGLSEMVGDTAPSAGFGAGIQIHLRGDGEREREIPDEHGWGPAQIELRLRWITSRPAAVVRKGTLVWDGDEYVYTTDRTAVSFFQPYVGITFGF